MTPLQEKQLKDYIENHHCIVCNLKFGIERVYKTGMYQFCSEKCYTKFRELSSSGKWKERSKIGSQTDSKHYQSALM